MLGCQDMKEEASPLMTLVLGASIMCIWEHLVELCPWSRSSGKLAVWSGNNLTADLSFQKPAPQRVLIQNVAQTHSALHIKTWSHPEEFWHPYSRCKPTHSLPSLTSLGSRWNSAPSVSPVHFACGLERFWPPCSVPVLQVTFWLPSNCISALA